MMLLCCIPQDVETGVFIGWFGVGCDCIQVNCDLQVHIERYQCSFSLVSLQRGIQRVVTGVITGTHIQKDNLNTESLLLILTHKIQNDCIMLFLGSRNIAHE